jgi:hypothetical protein
VTHLLCCVQIYVAGLSAANKDLLALHNGAWTSASNLASSTDDKRSSEGGQEKIVRAFGEVMKNMQRMKTYVRPAMCKPYGKQSEALQKSKFLNNHIFIVNY